MRTLLPLTILLLTSFHINAADIKFDTNVLELSGEIKNEDYDKFVELIIQRKAIPITVYLDSPGGDVMEAIKIGRLMKKILAQSIINKNGQCNSACFLIWASATIKFPSQANLDFNGYVGKIGLHRPFFEQSSYATLNTTKAKEEYKKLEAYVKDYLNEIQIPSDIIETMFRTKSTDASFITDMDLIEKIGQKAPFFEEWLIAKCGGLTEKESNDAVVLTLERMMELQGKPIPESEKESANMSAGYKDYIRNKNATINTCNMNAVKQEQSRVLQELLGS